MRPWTIASVVAASCLLCAGCLGPSYEDLEPAEGVAYNAVMPETRGDEWFWVRGRISGNVAGAVGEESMPEEALLVTLQTDADRPGDSPEAWVIVVRVDAKRGKIDLLARERLYTASVSDPTAPMPPETPGRWPGTPLADGVIRLRDIDNDGRAEILAGVLCDGEDGPVALHRVWDLEDGNLRAVFAARALQDELELRVEDIDDDGVPELIVPQRIPCARDGDDPLRPTWPVVYARRPDGVWRHSNEAYPAAYDETLVRLLEDRALAGGSTTATDLYLGLVYSYRDETGMARRFLKMAADGSGPYAALARGVLNRVMRPASVLSNPEM